MTEDQQTLERVTRIAAVQVNPDDVIVIECDYRLTREQAEALIEQTQECFPGHRVMVLPKDIHLGVANTTGADQ